MQVYNHNHVNIYTKLWSDLKENSSVALLSPTYFLIFHTFTFILMTLIMLSLP